MQLSEQQLHMIVIAILLITVILLGIHINQMNKKEGYEGCILGQANTPNVLLEMSTPSENSVLGLRGIDRRFATNLRENADYYGKNDQGQTAESWMVGGDNMVGDNSKSGACN